MSPGGRAEGNIARIPMRIESTKDAGAVDIVMSSRKEGIG